MESIFEWLAEEYTPWIRCPLPPCQLRELETWCALSNSLGGRAAAPRRARC